MICQNVLGLKTWKRLEIFTMSLFPANKVHLTYNKAQMETIILLVSTSAVASLGCECVPVWLACKYGLRWLTVAVSAGRQGLPPHVEHHSHRTVVSCGAGESLSSAPRGIKPGAENWDLTVRAMTSCFAHLLPLLILVLIDSMFYDNIALSLSPPYVHRKGRCLATLQWRSCLYLVIYMCCWYHGDWI